MLKMMYPFFTIKIIAAGFLLESYSALCVGWCVDYLLLELLIVCGLVRD